MTRGTKKGLCGEPQKGSTPKKTPQNFSKGGTEAAAKSMPPCTNLFLIKFFTRIHIFAIIWSCVTTN